VQPWLRHKTCANWALHLCSMRALHQVMAPACSTERAHLVSTKWQLETSSGLRSKLQMCCRISGGRSPTEVLLSASGCGLAFKAMLTVTPWFAAGPACMEQLHCNHQQAFCFNHGACSARISVIPLCIQTGKVLYASCLLAAVVCDETI
jgi:hypothetical protein